MLERDFNGFFMATRPRQATKISASDIDIEKVLSSADPKLGFLIDAVRSRIGVLRPALSKSSPFESLLRAIVYQRMASKSATTIYKRLLHTVAGQMTPHGLLAVSSENLRAAGLSNSKTMYARDLGKWFETNRAVARHLSSMSDEDVVKALTGIKGVGRWTVNVFLIFNLGRLDVLPTDDLGIRRGIQFVYRLRRMPTPKIVEKISMRWVPYRSIASMYLWNAMKLKLSVEDLRVARSSASNASNRAARIPSF